MSSPSTAPCSRLVGLLLLMVGLTVAPAPLLAQASYFNMSAGDYSQNFDDIATWTTPTTGSWQGLATNATGTIPSATRITAGSTSFAATSSSGVQKGTANLQCLATGTTDNTSSTAIDLLLNFAGRNAGNLGFDAATVFNSTGNRVGTLRVYYSTDGASWSEVVGGGLPYAATNNVAGSAAVSVALPSAINNASTTQLRFYYNNGTGGSTGSRPKISLDNVLVTSTPASAGAPVITSPTTDSAVAFQSYSYQITASNSPTSYAASNLPTGLTVNTSTGLISGSPTATGVYSIPIFASNAQGTGGATLTLTVTKNPGAPTITSALTAIGDLGSPFNYQITAENSPTSYSSGTLPAGLSLDTGTGLITGTPTAGGSFNVSITASNSLGSDTKTLVVTINSPPVITSSLSGSLYATNAFGYTITASFSPTSFGASGLPGGWTVDTATGAITSGVTALTLGSTSFQISATNAFGSTSNTYTLAVYDQTTQNAIPLNVVVNKYVNAAVDKVQLLVVGNNTPGSTADLRGMIVKDFSTSMANDSGGKFVFTTNVLWSSVRAGTFISLSAGNTQPEDIDPSDFYLAVNLGNTNYFANGGGSFDIATTDMLMVKQAGSGVSGVAGGIHALAGGTAGAQFTAFTGAKLITTGTSGTELGVVALNSTASLTNFGVSGAVASTDAQGGVAAASLNFASWNNTNNQTYVESLRSAVPTINASPSTLTNLAATQGTPGVSTNFTASASNLSNNITVSANDAVNFAISTNNTDFTNTLTLLTNATGGLSNTPVYVRLTGAAQGAQSTTISLVSGSTSTNVAVSGTVTGTGPASIGLNPTSATNLVAFTGSPGTAQQISVTGTGLSDPIQFTAAPSDQYEVAAQGGNFGVAATLPASGGVALVRIKSGAGSAGSAQLTFDSGSTSNTVALNGTRISGGTGGLVPSLLTFANDLNFTATARFVWVLKSDTVSGRGTEFSGVNVGGNFGVAAGASFDVVLNGAGSSTDFSMDFWKSARSWLVFSVTGNTTGAFSLGAITPDTGGKYYASYGSFSLRTDTGGDVYLDWTPSGLAVASISVNPGSLSLPGTTTNVAGASTNFTASGVNLTNNITVTAADPVNFAISTNSANGFAGSLVLTNTGGTVASTPVYVRLTGATNGSFNSAVNLISGTTSNSVTVSGAVNLPGAATLSPANNTAFSGFTTVRGTNSTNQTFTLSGSNLAAPVIVTPPAGWEVSATNTNNFTASAVTIATNPTGVVSNTAIHVRLAGTNAAATNYVNSILPLAVPGSLTNNVLLSGSVTDATPVISRTPTSLSGFSTPRGQASTNQSFTLSGANLTAPVTITPPAGWQISATNTNNFTASAVTIATNPAGVVSNTAIHVRLAGTNAAATNYTNVVLPLVSAAASNNVLLSGSVTNPPPALTANPASLTNFFAVAGAPSAVTNYSLTGSNLTTNVTVSAPSGFQVALTNTNSAFTNTLSITNSGSISNSIWVRVAANASTNTNLTGNITNTSGAAATNVALQGRVVPAPSLSAVPTALSNFTTLTGIASTNQSFNLTASNLLGPVTMTVTNGYEISFSTNSGFTTGLVVAPTNAFDVASNYTSATWTNGANQGSGFGPWALPGGNGGTGFNGAFIGPATNTLSNYAPLYTGGVAFSIYAGGSGSAFQDADRNLERPLAVGETLTHSFGIAFDNGNKGFDLYNGTNQVFNFNVNSSGYSWTGGNTAPPTPYPTNREFGAVINFSFTRTTNGFTYAISSPQDSNLTRSGSLTNGGIDRLKYYISGAGGGDPGNIYFNNFRVAYAGGNISNLPVYVRLATNAPISEATNSLASRVTISSTNATSAFVNLSGNVEDRPTLSAIPGAISNLVTTNGYASAPTNFVVTGRNLSGDVTIAVTPTDGFEISTNGISWTSSITVPRANVNTAQQAQTTYNAFNDFYVNVPATGGNGDYTRATWIANAGTVPFDTGLTNPNTWGYAGGNFNGVGAPSSVGTYVSGGNFYPLTSGGTFAGPGASYALGGGNFWIGYNDQYGVATPGQTQIGKYTREWFSGSPNWLSNSNGTNDKFLWLQGTGLSASTDGLGAMLTWTAPNAGTFQFSGSYVNGDYGQPTSFAVVDSRNNTLLAKQTLAPKSSASSFNFTRSYAAGDVVQFQAGTPAAAQGSPLGLSVEVAPVSAAFTQLVYIRIASTAAVGALSGNVSVSSPGATSVNVPVTGDVLPDTSIPVITASTYALSGLGSVEGSPGASTNFAVSGVFLRGPVTVTAANSALAVSADNTNFGTSVSLPRDASNSLPPTPVYVRITEFALVSANTNVFLGNLVLDTTRNSNNLPAPTNVAVFGTVTNWSIANPYGIRVTNPVEPLSTNGTNFTFRGQIGTAIDRNTLSWFNLLNSQSNSFIGGTNWTWSATAPLGVGFNTFVFSGQFLTNAGTTNVALDAAGDSAYAPPGGWVSGDNGGFGFGPWQLYSEDGLSALYRTDTWASTNMNVSGYYGFAFESIVGGLANAYRPFVAPLQAPGGSFTVYFDSNDLQPQGSVGLQLVSSNKTPLFTFAAANNGSGATYRISDKTNAAVDPGWSYNQEGLLLRFEMTSSNAYSFTASSSTFTNTNNGTISNAAVAGVIFFTEGAGPTPDCNFYVGQMEQNSTLYSYESVSTVAPDVERTAAPPATAYELWAQGYGLHPAGNGAPAADPDKDGFANDMEFAFGTSPVVANGTLLNVGQSGGKMVVTFLARMSSVSYSVMQKANLAVSIPAWVDTGITPTIAGDQSGIPDPTNYERRTFGVPATGQNFYRVRATFSQ